MKCKVIPTDVFDELYNYLEQRPARETRVALTVLDQCEEIEYAGYDPPEEEKAAEEEAAEE